MGSLLKDGQPLLDTLDLRGGLPGPAVEAIGLSQQEGAVGPRGKREGRAGWN